jgi:hypothetical protein
MVLKAFRQQLILTCSNAADMKDGSRESPGLIEAFLLKGVDLKY